MTTFLFGTKPPPIFRHLFAKVNIVPALYCLDPDSFLMRFQISGRGMSFPGLAGMTMEGTL